MTHQSTEIFSPPLEKRVEELSQLSDLVGEFMKIERATYRDGRPETDGEHTIHVMFLAVAYAAKYHPEYDTGEVALLTMIHDLDEVYVGDVNSLTADDEAMQEKERNEERSRDTLRSHLCNFPKLLDLLERYWAQDDPVVKFVRSFEKFDPSFVHQRDGGRAIRAMGITTTDQYRELDTRAIERMSEYAAPDIIGIRRILGAQVMESTFDTV